MNGTANSPPNEPGTVLERANMALIRYGRFKELHRDILRCQEVLSPAGLDGGERPR